MRVLAICLRWLPAALVLAFVPAVHAAPAAPVSGNATNAETPAQRIRKALDQVRDVNIENQTLPLAINQLREETKINFVLDQASLMAMNMMPDQLTVNVKLKNVKVRSALRTMLSPYHLTCVVVGETALISTEEMGLYRQLRQHVSVDVEKQPMATCARQLARDTGTNILVDAKVEKEANTPVTIQLDDVPLETAVRLLAEMVGLKPVRVGNVLYVTNKQTAGELRQEPDLAPPPNGVNPNVMMMGGMGGVMVAPAVAGGPPVPAAPPAVLPESPPEKPEAAGEKKEEKKPEDKGSDAPKKAEDAPKKADEAPKKEAPKEDKR